MSYLAFARGVRQPGEYGLIGAARLEGEVRYWGRVYNPPASALFLRQNGVKSGQLVLQVCEEDAA
jgi:hypothetical protein